MGPEGDVHTPVVVVPTFRFPSPSTFPAPARRESAINSILANTISGARVSGRGGVIFLWLSFTGPLEADPLSSSCLIRSMLQIRSISLEKQMKILNTYSNHDVPRSMPRVPRKCILRSQGIHEDAMHVPLAWSPSYRHR